MSFINVCMYGATIPIPEMPEPGEDKKDKDQEVEGLGGLKDIFGGG
jgi:hypothetical protein